MGSIFTRNLEATSKPLLRPHDPLSLPHDIDRKRIEVLDDVPHLLAAHESDLQVYFCAFGDELRIVHGIRKGLAQSGSYAQVEHGRSDHRTAHGLTGKNKLENLLSIALGNQIDDQW